MKYNIKCQYFCLPRFFSYPYHDTSISNLLSYFISFIESVFLLGSMEFGLLFLFNTTVSSI